MEHKYLKPYRSFFTNDKMNESFLKDSVQVALEKATRIIGRRLGKKLYLSIIPQDVIKQDGRKLSGLIATFDGNKQIRFNWKTVDSSSTIVGCDIWFNVKSKLFTPSKEIVFENDQNILQIIDAVVQAIQNEKEINSVIKIVESEDRLREDVVSVDAKTQGKVSQAIKDAISTWSNTMGIDDDKLANTRFATLYKDYEYFMDSVNTNPDLKLINYGTFRNYLLSYMEKYGVKNIFMRSVVSKEGTKERVIVTDDVSEKVFNKELYKLTVNDQFYLAKANVGQVLNGSRVATGLCGKAGTGKTKLVSDILNDVKGKAKIVYLKGGDIRKPSDLYDLLVETNSPSTVICIDDFDTPFIKKEFNSILKGMFDSTVRIITNLDPKYKADDKKHPNQIVLKSRFIIITNISKNKMDEAIESRLNPVEIVADSKGMLDYIQMNLDGILTEYKIPKEVKIEVLDFLYSVLKDITFINFRVFHDALLYRFTDPESPYWRKFVYNMITKTAKK